MGRHELPENELIRLRDLTKNLFDERNAAVAEVARLREALDWYFMHWGTNSEEFKKRGYYVAKEALGKKAGE